MSTTTPQYTVRRRANAATDGGPTNFAGTGYEVLDASGTQVHQAGFVCDAEAWIDEQQGDPYTAEDEARLDAAEAAHDAWCDEQMERGELAFAPEELECHVCKCRRPVAKLGRIAEARRDPTQTYVLACGHTVI